MANPTKSSAKNMWVSITKPVTKRVPPISEDLDRTSNHLLFFNLFAALLLLATLTWWFIDRSRFGAGLKAKGLSVNETDPAKLEETKALLIDAKKHLLAYDDTTFYSKLVSGEVRMETNYSLEPWEMQAGFVLTCQSHPLTKEVTVDYDTV